MAILPLLKKFGFSDREAKIYLALIKKIETSAYVLAKETGIPRGTIYEVLEEMKVKGFISSSKVNGKLLYTCESPNRLISSLKEKEEAIFSAIPLLQAFRSKKDVSPKVKLYLGREGTKRVLDDIVETLEHTGDKQLYAIAGMKLHYEHSDLLKSWIKKREKLQIHSKLIAYDDGKGVEPELYPTNVHRETRLIPPIFAFDSTVDIYADKVAIFSEIEGKEHSLIIESPSISETFKKFHQFMWENAKKIQ
jgi:sugar-specific transcriptional regulator TrmB